LTTFPASLPPNPASPLNALFASSGPCVSTQGQDAVDCVGVALASQFISDLPTPINGVTRSSSDVTLDATSITPVGLLSAVASAIPGSDAVLAQQGTISLPYYLGDTPADIAGMDALSWTADDGLATNLNNVFSSLGVSLPQADPSKSTVVNSRFPFPKVQSTQEVPFLVLYPKSGPSAGVVIYQHGITTDRSAALTFGTGLAAQGFIVVAIDHPLHGVAPFSTKEQEDLADILLAKAGLDVTATNRTALINGQLSLGLLQQLIGAGCSVTTVGEVLAGACDGIDPTASQAMAGLVSIENTVANAGSTIPGLAPMIGKERHFGIYADASGAPQAMNFDPANAAGVDGSGSLYINLLNFLTARDNNRQSIVDQMNLRASVKGLVLARPTAAGGSGNDLTVGAGTGASGDFFFAGHSLGTITGMPFVSAINANQIPETIFTAADGSSSIASTSNDILSASMLTPGGGIVRLLENSPTFAPRILLGLQTNAGLTQGDAALESYFNVLQTAIDAADPVNFTASLGGVTPVLLSAVRGDTVIPNAADKKQWDIAPLSGTFSPSQTGLPVSVTVDSFNAPLAGTLPLTIGLGADSIDFYEEGNHGTPTSADNDAVFGGMLCKTYVTFGVALGDLPTLCTAP
jgi:hypothetical protein